MSDSIKKINLAGYILPLMMMGSLLYFFISQYYSSKKFKNEMMTEKK
jgi:hypothetical protein